MKAWLLFALVGLVSACGPSQPAADEVSGVAEAGRSIRLAAEQGDAEAQYKVGLSYQEGDGVPQDSAEAVKWYQLAAEQGNEEALASLSLMLLGEAANLQLKVWNKTGLLYERIHKDPAEAVKWDRLAAEQGDAEGQFHVGRMYELVSQDYAEAVKWYRLAAEQGNADAQNFLGAMYDRKSNGMKDSAEAVKWFRLSAEQGNADAQRDLGSFYHLGNGGVLQDYVQAHMWYNLAASRAKGDYAREYAELRDGLSNKYLTRAQLAEAQRLAREWKPKTWEELKARD